MGDHRADAPLRSERAVCCNIRFIQRLCCAAPRVARKKLECVRTDGQRFVPHVQKAFRAGKVASYLRHMSLLLYRFFLQYTTRYAIPLL